MMKATSDKIKHYAEGTLFLLRFDSMDDSHPATGSVRLARKTNDQLVSAPVDPDEYTRHDFHPSMVNDPKKWTTLLNGYMHTILQTFPPDGVWDARIPTNADVGLVARAKTRDPDLPASYAVRFVIDSVSNGYVRVEGGGSYKVTDYTWEIDVYSRKPTPTESMRKQYIEALRDSIQPYIPESVINVEEFVDGFIERYTEALAEERRLGPATDDGPDREIDPDFG